MGHKKKIGLPGGPNEIINDSKGQWNHPGKNTRIDGNDITMDGVKYPVWAQPNVGEGIMMFPNQNYSFPEAEYVDEYPVAQDGGTITHNDTTYTVLHEGDTTVTLQPISGGSVVHVDADMFKEMKLGELYNLDKKQTWTDKPMLIENPHLQKELEQNRTITPVQQQMINLNKQREQLQNFITPKEKGGSVSWNWKGKSYSGTLIPSMETEENRYARTKNGKIKTLPKAQFGNIVKSISKLTQPVAKKVIKNADEWDSSVLRYLNTTDPGDVRAYHPNWGKWNKSIPDNKELLEEYDIIEQATRANDTYMKNLDGSVFKGTPEQFIQSKSTNFKNAYPEGVGVTYRGTYAGHEPHKSVGSIFTADKKGAIHYGSDHVFKSPDDLGNLSLDGYKKGSGHFQFYYPSSKNVLNIDAKGSGFRNLPTKTIEGFKIPDAPEYHNLYNELRIPNQKIRTTEDIARILEQSNIDYSNIKNVLDGTLLDEVIYNNQKGRFLKSAWGNDGMFDLTNKNLFQQKGGELPKAQLGKLLKYLTPSSSQVKSVAKEIPTLVDQPKDIKKFDNVFYRNTPVLSNEMKVNKNLLETGMNKTLKDFKDENITLKILDDATMSSEYPQVADNSLLMDVFINDAKTGRISLKNRASDINTNNLDLGFIKGGDFPFGLDQTTDAYKTYGKRGISQTINDAVAKNLGLQGLNLYTGMTGSPSNIARNTKLLEKGLLQETTNPRLFKLNYKKGGDIEKAQLGKLLKYGFKIPTPKSSMLKPIRSYDDIARKIKPLSQQIKHERPAQGFLHMVADEIYPDLNIGKLAEGMEERVGSFLKKDGSNKLNEPINLYDGNTRFWLGEQRGKDWDSWYRNFQSERPQLFPEIKKHNLSLGNTTTGEYGWLNPDGSLYKEPSLRKEGGYIEEAQLGKVLSKGYKSLKNYVLPVSTKLANDLYLTVPPKIKAFNPDPSMIGAVTKGPKPPSISSMVGNGMKNQMFLQKYMDGEGIIHDNAFGIPAAFFDNPMDAGRGFNALKGLMKKGDLLYGHGSGSLSTDSYKNFLKRGNSNDFDLHLEYDIDKMIPINTMGKEMNYKHDFTKGIPFDSDLAKNQPRWTIDGENYFKEDQAQYWRKKIDDLIISTGNEPGVGILDTKDQGKTTIGLKSLLAPNPYLIKKQIGGVTKLLKTLSKTTDNAAKLADDIPYTDKQLSNYNYAVDMGVPGIVNQNPANLDDFLSGSFNKRPVYRTVDLNTDVIKQESVISDMVSKGFNPDDKLDVASYMGTNTPLEVLQDFNKGRRSIHSDILQGSGKDLLYTSDNPDWLIPNYGGSDPYMVKMFLDEKPATVVDQINALSTKFRKPVNDAVGLTPVPQYNLLGTNPINIGDVPSGALVDNLYKYGNTIYPILGDFGQQLRKPVRVSSGDDFFKIRAKGEEFQKGGQLDNQLDTYKKYVLEELTTKEDREKGKKIYDKLNRVYYKDAKKMNMNPSNYIMTYLITN